MKVLALASYPIEAAATRYRLHQFVKPLAERGITLDIRPFLNSQQFKEFYKRAGFGGKALGLMRSALGRLSDTLAASDADVVLVQREAMIFGPPLVEWLATRLARRPMVLDLDDATYVSYTSPTYGRFGSALKWFSKTDDLIRWAKVVTCGNRFIAEYVSGKGTRAVIIPTVVDTDRFQPAVNVAHEPVVLGWIGTHSTFPFLKSIVPALQELARTHLFRLKIVGAGEGHVDGLDGINLESLDWSLEREIEDFQSFDIGLYPIDIDKYGMQWASGKSGFKAIQYMAVGIPYVTTPIAACAEIGEAGITHFYATTQEEWRESLAKLISERDLRQRMGAAGRRHALEHYTVAMQADKLSQALREATGNNL